MYDGEYAEIYDLLMRHRGKDYAGQAADVGRIVFERAPSARSILDVACGSGLHLQHLAPQFDRVRGLDLSAEMVRLAASRIPGLDAEPADMREIDLGERFDAVLCMFAVPHLQSPDELATAVAAMAAHLNPGGVLVVEPWFAPEQFRSGYVAEDVARDGDRTVHRLTHSRACPGEPGRMRMVLHYVDAAPRTGIRTATDEITMSLFTAEEFENAFRSAGLEPERVEGPRFMWGLWVARRPG